MLGGMLDKQTELNKKIENLKILVSDRKANFAWVPSLNGQVPQEAIPGKGPFNNYVYKMRGEVVKKWQDSVHLL